MGTSTDDLIVKKDVATQIEAGHDTWDGNSDDTVLHDDQSTKNVELPQPISKKKTLIFIIYE